MAARDQDHWRIEVWDGDTLIEIAARSSTAAVIGAAWKAAILEYPGGTLVEYNGRHQVGRAEIPAAPMPVSEIIPGTRSAARLSVIGKVCLRDLPTWYQVVGICPRCKRVGEVDHHEIKRRIGQLNYIIDLQAKLRCKVCGRHDGNRFGAIRLPR